MKSINDYVSFLSELSNKKVSALGYISAVLNEYKIERIEGTNLDSDGDMLLLQWRQSDEDIEVMITRQVVQDENGTIEFDDCAVQINFVLYFKNDDNVFKAGNTWIDNPTQLKDKVSAIIEINELKPQLHKTPYKVIVNYSNI